MAEGNVENRARLEMWVSALVLIGGWCACVLGSKRSALGLVVVGGAYVATYVALRVWRLRAR